MGKIIIDWVYPITSLVIAIIAVIITHNNKLDDLEKIVNKVKESDILKADIIIYKPNSLISSLIALISGMKYTHVAIYLSENKIIESTWKGVKIKPFKDKKGLEIFQFENITEEERESVIQWIMSKVNSKYDWKLFLTIMLERWFNIRPLDSQQQYICSELVNEAYKVIGIDIFKSKKYLNPTPEELEIALSNLDNVVKYSWKY